MTDRLTDAKLTARLQGISRLAARIMIVIAVLALAGWMLGVETLTSVLPGLVTMKVNTAVCLMLAGIGLLTLHTRPNVTRGISVAVLVISGLTATQHLFGWNLGIDELLVRDTTPGIAPGRMSPVTTFNFLLLGTALLLLTGGRIVQAQVLGIAVLLTSGLAFLGYIYDVAELNRVFLFSFVAINTVFSTFLASMAVLFAQPDRGLAHIFSVTSAGGFMARRLLPVAVLLPVVAGVLLWQGRTIGPYDESFVLAAFTLANVIILSLLILFVASRLHAVDVDRRVAVDAEQAVLLGLEQKVAERTRDLQAVNDALAQEIAQRQRAEEQFRALLESAPDGIIVVGALGRIVLANRQIATMLGYSREELGTTSVRNLMPEADYERLLAYRDALASDDWQSTGSSLEATALRRDGTRIPIEISLSHVATPDGEVIFGAIRDITDRREYEQTLRFNASLQESVRDAVISTDMEFRIQSWNRAAENIYGWHAEEVIGRPVGEILPTRHSSDTAMQVFRQALMSRGYWQGEFLQKRRDGVEITVLGSTTLLKDEYGASYGVVSVNHDLTERKKSESEARRLQAALDIMQEGAQVIGFDWRYIYQNEAAARQGKQSRDNVIGRSMMDVFPGIEHTHVFGALRRCMEQRIPEHVETLFEFSDGSSGWFDVFVQPIPEGIFVISSSADERKRAEKEARRLQVALDNMQDGAQIISHDWEYVYLNDTAARQARKPREDMLGRTMLEKFPGIDATPMFSKLRQAMEQRTTEHFENLFSYDDGSSAWFELSVQPVPEGIFILSADITARKEIELALQRTNEQLQHANEEIQRFAYIVSHDLRGPLINLKGFSEILRGAVETMTEMSPTVLPALNAAQTQMWNSATGEKIPTALRFISTALDRMDRFTTAILGLSRVGSRSLLLEPVSPEDLIRQIVQSCAMQIEQQGIEVEIQPLPEIVTDRMSLDQIFGNIIGNAIKYLDPKRRGCIRIYAEQDVLETIFHVEDNGRGIADNHHEKVFAPFRRGISDVEGEGMGLAYVQALVRRLDGRIWFESRAGVGTTFSFALPNRREEPV
jgi:PAS domain S-box-containing protein